MSDLVSPKRLRRWFVNLLFLMVSITALIIGVVVVENRWRRDDAAVAVALRETTFELSTLPGFRGTSDYGPCSSDSSDEGIQSFLYVDGDGDLKCRPPACRDQFLGVAPVGRDHPCASL